jgi:chromosome segregation ATPase
VTGRGSRGRQALEGVNGHQLGAATPFPDGTGGVADLAGELAGLRDQADRYEVEVLRLRGELDRLQVERDAARLDAEAHAEATRVVSDVMEKLVEKLRGELDELAAVAAAHGSCVEVSAEDLVRERDELRARLAEIEGSRAWAAVTRYRDARLRLLPRS